MRGLILNCRTQRHARVGLVTMWLLGCAVLARAEGELPAPLWIAPLGGRSLTDAWACGAQLSERLPAAVLVDDAASARALAGAGFAVTGPLDVGADETLLLLHASSASADVAVVDKAVLASLGARAVWRDGRDLVIAASRPLEPDARLAPFSRQVLRRGTLRRPAVSAAAAKTNEPQSTVFDPAIAPMVARIDSTAYLQYIVDLATRFPTRYTESSGCSQAEEYVHDAFAGMGFSDVQYQPYVFDSTDGRNVIATLPGAVTPHRIVIVGGHVDSTSPTPATLAPGANDNASGTAAVLSVARVLHDYLFRDTIRFIAFTGEEQGLRGSQYYVQQAVARGDSIVAVVICDMVAWDAGGYRISIQGERPDSGLMQIMHDACAAYTGLSTRLEYATCCSDHVPFEGAGYPAVLAIEDSYADYPCYHRTCDTWEKNSARMGADVSRACLATAAQVAGPASFAITHTPLPHTTDTAGPYAVVARIASPAPLRADALLLHYSLGWSYFQTPLLPTGDPFEYAASIPGQAAITHVRYYLTAADAVGTHLTAPAAAPDDVYGFYVGPRTRFWREGFEKGPGGWTHGGTHDEWQWGAPQGLDGDPAVAHAGARVFGTDLTGLGTNLGGYEALCDTWLQSPAIDCSRYAGVTLSFWRWLAVERKLHGTLDDARIDVNDVMVWQNNVPSGDFIDPDWSLCELDIAALADGNPAVRIKFTLKSDATTEYGGWNIDDLELRGIVAHATTETAGTPLPRALTLFPGTPNPGNAATTLRFELPARSPAVLSIYDARGRLVRTLLRRDLDAGPHRTVWDGRDAAGLPLPAGVYLCRLQTPAATRATKLVLVR